MGEFGGINRIDDGVAYAEARTPIVVFHPFTQRHIPLPGATRAAIEKIKIGRLVAPSHDPIGKTLRVQRRPRTNAGTTVEDQMLPDQLGLGASRD